MSEDRSDRLKSEQQRIKEYIKEVERLIRLEKSLQGQTEGGADAKTHGPGARPHRRPDGRSGRARFARTKKVARREDQKPGDQKPDEAKPGEEQAERAETG